MQHIDQTFQELLRGAERVHLVPRNPRYWDGFGIYYHYRLVSKPSDVPWATRFLADAIQIESKAYSRCRIHVSMPYIAEIKGKQHLGVMYRRADLNERLDAKI